MNSNTSVRKQWPSSCKLVHVGALCFSEYTRAFISTSDRGVSDNLVRSKPEYLGTCQEIAQALLFSNSVPLP